MTPLVRGWRLVLVGTLAIGAAVVVSGLLSARRYRASITLSTIVNPRTSSALPGGLGQLLNAGAGGVLQPTPALIVRLAGQYGVLHRVAHAPMGTAPSPRIIDRLAAQNGEPLSDREAVGALDKLVRRSFDRATGVISIDVVAQDTALARAVASRLVEEISQTFVRVSKAQASEMRKAMETRVDSAARQLRRVEESRQAFLSTNRVVTPFSSAAVEQQRFEQAVQIARSVYSQAVMDRESAIARELEETPAVVVIDPLPSELLPEPRRIALKALAALLLGFVLMSLVVLARSSMRSATEAGDANAEGFIAALEDVPIIGRASTRLFGITPGRSARTRREEPEVDRWTAPLRRGTRASGGGGGGD